jgi:hypothetical protein
VCEIINQFASANEQQYSSGVVLWQNIIASEQKIDRITSDHDGLDLLMNKTENSQNVVTWRIRLF